MVGATTGYPQPYGVDTPHHDPCEKHRGEACLPEIHPAARNNATIVVILFIWRSIPVAGTPVHNIADGLYAETGAIFALLSRAAFAATAATAVITTLFYTTFRLAKRTCVRKDPQRIGTRKGYAAVITVFLVPSTYIAFQRAVFLL